MAFGLSAWKRNNIKAMWSEFLGYTGWFNVNFLLFQPISIILELLKCFSGILAPLRCRKRWCSYLWFWSYSSEVLDASFVREPKMAYVNKINKDSRRSDAYSSRDASVCENEISWNGNSRTIYALSRMRVSKDLYYPSFTTHTVGCFWTFSLD